jgi:hypothetical protein
MKASSFLPVRSRLRGANAGPCFKRHMWNSSSVIPYRDVFVTDHMFTDTEWIKIGMLQSKQIMSPTSKHIVSAYAKCVHQGGAYSLSQDYSLNVLAAHCTKEVHGSVKVSEEKFGDLKHSVLIWPDAVIIENLLDVSVPFVSKFITKETVPDWEALAPNLGGDSTVKVHKLDGIVIVMSLSASFRYNQAVAIQALFEKSFEVHNKAQLPVTYYYCNELRQHRDGTRIIIFPFEDCFEDVPSAKKVDSVVAKICATV